MQIIWDPEKTKENRSKHGVAFPDAEPALFDPHAITREDEYAEGEQRFVTVGLDALGRALVAETRLLHPPGLNKPVELTANTSGVLAATHRSLAWWT